MLVLFAIYRFMGVPTSFFINKLVHSQSGFFLFLLLYLWDFDGSHNSGNSSRIYRDLHQWNVTSGWLLIISSLTGWNRRRCRSQKDKIFLSLAAPAAKRRARGSGRILGARAPLALSAAAAFRISPIENELDTRDCRVPCERALTVRN